MRSNWPPPCSVSQMILYGGEKWATQPGWSRVSTPGRRWGNRIWTCISSALPGESHDSSMKLLVVSHSSATATNQRVYAELGRLTGWDITLVIPRNWKDEFGRELDEAPLPALQGKVRTLPVAGNGSIVFHFYR